MGQHTFKGGVQWERLSNDVLRARRRPTVTLELERGADHADAAPRQVRGTYGYYTVARGTYTEGNDPLEQPRRSSSRMRGRSTIG